MTTNAVVDTHDSFPKIKLSYEKMSHKKVHDADIILAIPFGKKCFAWFTHLDNKRVCYILEVNNGEIVKKHLYPACFHKDLSHNSIFFGTFINFNNTPFVAIEDIHMYKGTIMTNRSYGDKLPLLEKILSKELQQKAPGRHFVSFGMPMFHNDHDKLLSILSSKQRVMYFQYRYFHKNNIIRVKPHVVFNKTITVTNEKHEQPIRNAIQRQPIIRKTFRTNVIEKIFTVTPDIQNDIYHLHDHTKEYIGKAYIPDYKTSVMLNKLFRNIKENENLDTLEESDDEDEFQCEDIDKFVSLDTSYKMICSYNHKFKMWVPIKIAENRK